MSREYRYKLSGMIFFVVMLSHLLLSYPGIKFINHAFKITSNQDVIKIILSIAIPIFSSESIGFIFSSIVYFVFTRCFGGYKKLYEFKDKHLVEMIDYMYTYSKSFAKSSNHWKESFEEKFSHRFKQYNTEQKFIYFLWHNKEGVNPELQYWIERRFNAFFAAYSFFAAISLANIFSILLLSNFQFDTNLTHRFHHFIHTTSESYSNCYNQFTCFNLCILILSCLISVIMILNGNNAIKDAKSITDMHIASYFNPAFKDLLDQINKQNDQNTSPIK